VCGLTIEWMRPAHPSPASRFRPAGPAAARPIEKRRLLAGSCAPDNPLEARHEPRLAMMVAADFGYHRLPLRIEPRALVAALRFFEVRQSLIVVFALAGVDNAYAQSAEDSRGHAWMSLGETLGRGLGNVMAQNSPVVCRSRDLIVGRDARSPLR
jgi:hypothetical protein